MQCWSVRRWNAKLQGSTLWEDVKADQKLLTICCSHLALSANRHTHALQSAVVLEMQMPSSYDNHQTSPWFNTWLSSYSFPFNYAKPVSEKDRPVVESCSKRKATEINVTRGGVLTNIMQIARFLSDFRENKLSYVWDTLISVIPSYFNHFDGWFTVSTLVSSQVDESLEDGLMSFRYFLIFTLSMAATKIYYVHTEWL